MKIPPQNISTSLNTIDTYVSNELVSKKIFNNLLDSLFQTNLVEAICVDSNADCQTIIGVKNNGLVAVEYSLLNRIKAIFGYGPLARVDLDKRKVSEYIASNWEQFSPNINSYSGLKKIKCLASHLKLSDVNSKVEPMYKCINELQEAGFGFKQAQKWFHLQKNIADSYNPKTQSFKAISNFYNCVQTDKKKSFFKLLKTLEDKEHPLREACFLTLSNHPDDADTVDLLEKLYSNSCFALLNLSEKLYVQSTISNDKYLYKQNIQIINKLFTDSLYSSWPKTQKNSVLQALKKYPLNASLIETLYMSAGFNLADEKYKSQLITLLEIKGNYFNEVSTLIEDLATNPDFSLSGSPQEINWLLSELINFLNDKNFLATKLTNVLDFIKKLYTDPDYSFLKKEVHMHCDPSHTNCGLNINLTHIASYYQKEIPLEELRLAYQDSHEFFNLEMILRSVNNGPVSYSKFMEMKPDLEPLLTKREKSDDEEKPTIKDNYMLAYYFQDISASVRKETCRLLSEIFTFMNLSNHVASVKKTGNQSLTQVKKAKSGTKPLFLTRNTVKKH